MAGENLIMFTPMGGMNQDDSMVTPSKDAGGASLFENGDYRYALNARIGSSRSDHFGDLENLKSTEKGDNYWALVQSSNNPNFPGGITPPWTVLHETGKIPWTYGAAPVGSGIKFESTTVQESDILYQAQSANAGSVLNISYNFQRSSRVVSASFNIDLTIVFLMNGVVVGSTVIDDLNDYVSGPLTNQLVVTCPVACNQIGFKLSRNQHQSGITLRHYFTLFSISSYVLTNTTKPSGTEKVIGRLNDPETQNVYYAVWNSEGNHCIRYWNKFENKVYEVFKWSGLNFESTYFVSMAKIDSWICFTDRNNRPRLINVDTIADMFIDIGSANFREFHISLHKWQPNMPPIVRGYYDGVTDNQEKLKGFVNQWAYRYVYKGNLRSRWSPASVAANAETPKTSTDSGSGDDFLTAFELFVPGVIYNDPASASAYNYFSHDDAKFYKSVIAIEYGYRNSVLDLWRIFKTVEVNASITDLVRYDGSLNSTPIPDDDFYQLFDTVPFKAGVVEAIDNRFVFGDCLDEHEPADAPVLESVGVVTWNGASNSGYWNAAFGSVFSGMSVNDRVELAKRNGVTDWTFKSRGKYKVGITFQDKNGWESGVYTVDAWIYEIPATTNKVAEAEYALTFKFDPSFRPPEWAVSYQIVRTDCLNIDYFLFGVANEFQGLIDDISQILSNTTLSQASKDRIRQHFENSKLVTAEEINKDIAAATKAEAEAAKKLSYRRSRLDTNLALNKYLRTNPIYRSIGPEVRKTTVGPATIADCSRIYININNWYNASKKNASGTTNNPMNKLFYNFREGDRVRLLGSDIAAPSDSQKIVFDVPILEFTGNAIIIERPETLLWIPKSGGTSYRSFDFVIEVYTPKIPQESDFIYYETGEWYPVLYPGTESRTWSKSDWTYTNNAAVTASTYGDIIVYNKYPFTHGDCNFVTKKNYRDLQAETVNFVNVGSACMTNKKDDMAGVWDKGNGRPNVAYTVLPTERFITTEVRFGGKIIEESMVNSLNRFQALDRYIYPSEYGRIRSLVNTSNAQVESTGSILLAIGEREAWSIYVNRTTLEDLSGNTQVILSDKVLGSYNTLLGSHGTLNPESVSKERGRVYWWDALDGAWVRYGRDGLTEISFYKMRNWFRELSGLLLDSYLTDTPALAISEFDSFNEELIVFQDHSGLPSTFRGYSKYKGCLFSEDNLRWKSVHSLEPEMMGRIGNQTVMFKDGDPYLYEKAATYSTFFGVKHDVMIEPVFNALPKNAKHWRVLQYVTTEKWSVERILSEYRGLKTIAESSIQLNGFELREDAYWGAIKGNINSVGGKFEGAAMRSKAIQVLMKLDPDVTTLSLLHYVMAEYSDSPKNT